MMVTFSDGDGDGDDDDDDDDEGTGSVMPVKATCYRQGV